VAIKVFFTWHAGCFNTPVAWDIPMTEGYDFELVPNISFCPETHRFFGLNNPDLVKRVTAWQPHAVHSTGWAWLSHLIAMRAFYQKRIVTLFRGREPRKHIK